MGFSMPSLPKLPDLPSLSDGPQGAMCKDMEDKLDAAIATLEKAKISMDSPLRSLSSKMDALRGGISTPIGNMTSALGGLSGQLDAAIPKPPSGIEQIKGMLESCGILKAELPSMSASAVGSKFGNVSIDGYKSILNGALDNLQNLLEFPVMKVLDGLKGMLSSFGLGALIKGLDGYLTCLDSMCGANISSKMDYVDSLLAEMNIKDDGEFDTDALFSTSGLPTDSVTNLKNIGDTLNKANLDLGWGILDSGEKLTNSIKGLKTVSTSDFITIPWA